MILRRNIFANFVSQFYVTLIGILVVPFYLRILGAEVYGLIGFFTVLQVLFNHLDLGLSQTMARETARHFGVGDALAFRRLTRAVHNLFLSVGLVVGISLFMAAGFLADHWLQSDVIPRSELIFAIQVMAFALAARWFSGLHRGMIMGAEKQVWLSGFNIAVATLRHVGVFAVLLAFDASVFVFFGYQAVLAAAELAALMWMTRHIQPAVDQGQRIGWSWKPLRPVLRFSLSLSFTSLVWVGITYTDKLVLSSLLPLAEYGAFTAAVMLASGVMLASAPIGMAARPRLAILDAKGDDQAFMRLYRQVTQLTAILAAAGSMTLAFFAYDFFLAWTGDAFVASAAAPLVQLYALGNALLAMTALPYYLQFAKGDLKLHVQGNAVFAIVLIPSMISATVRYGAIGAGWVWLGANAFFFVAWVALVHRRFAPGLHITWLGKDVAPIYAGAALMCAIARWIVPSALDRWWLLGVIGLIGFTSLAVAAAASSEARRRARLWMGSNRAVQA